MVSKAFEVLAIAKPQSLVPVNYIFEAKGYAAWRYRTILWFYLRAAIYFIPEFPLKWLFLKSNSFSNYMEQLEIARSKGLSLREDELPKSFRDYVLVCL
jgi:hypothetical protein